VQRSLNYMIVLLTAVALFAIAPVGDAMASPPTATSLFGTPTGGPDAPVQWLQNTVQGSNAPGGGTESFLGTYGIYNNNASGSIQAGLQMVLSWYSYAMLVIGSFLLLYYLVRIIAETAHTGRPGGRANQLWAPIRTVLAIGLLVPLSTGLNSGQMIVLNLASEGSQLASNTWSQFVSAMAGNIAAGANAALSSPTSAALETQAVYNYFLLAVCVKAANQLLTDSGDSAWAGKFGLPPTYWQVQGYTTSMFPSGTVTTYGNKWSQAACGQVESENPVAIANPTGANLGTGGSKLNNDMSSTAASLSSDITKAINTAWNSDVTGSGAMGPGPMSAAVDAYVTAVLAGNPAPISSTLPVLAGIVQTYNQDLTSGVTAAVTAATPAINDALVDDAAALGWLSAGSMYMTIARLQSTISEALMYAPTVVGPNMDQLFAGTMGVPVSASQYGMTFDSQARAPPTENQWQAPYEKRLIGIVGTASNLITNQGTTPTTFTLESGQIAASNGPEAATGGLLGIVDKIFAAVQTSGVVSPAVATGELPWIGNVVPTGGFPISDLAVLGANLMKMGAALYVAGAAGGIFSSGVSMIAFAFGTMLFAPGIALAYVLPLLPFIHFLFAVFGWLLALVEAVIEIPIFALAHLDPEGEGVFPQVTRSGYMLLLQLILRPLLICIGLIISILLMNGMVDFLNLVFNATVFGVQTTSKVGIFSEVIYTVIYAGTAYSICNACFKAVDYVPNHALRWIGASGDTHDSSQHAGYATAAAMGTASAAQTMAQVGPQLSASLQRGVAGAAAGGAGGLTGAATSSAGGNVGAAGGGAGSAASAAASASNLAASAAQSSGDVTGRNFNIREGLGAAALTGGSVGGAVGDGLQAAGSNAPLQQPEQEQPNKPSQRDPTSFIT
jgi:conjugal transfer/type IV secretion protein DotA/TraY